MRAVRLGAGFVEFEFSDRTERVEASDFGNARIAQGTLTFTHRDAKWFTGKGRFSFTYGGLGNARLFLFCLERLAGIKLN